MLGIDQLNFYTSNYFLEVQQFARTNPLATPNYLNELGQKTITVIPPSEDIVTLAANAAAPFFKKDPSLKTTIGLVIFATETAFDTAKSAASYLHAFFDLPSDCRIIEMKQACYAATFGLFTGLQWLLTHPKQKVLLVAADVAKYPVNSKAELTSGGGGIAMILAHQPALCAVNLNSGVCTKEVLDFWHPQFLPYALVNGRLSCTTYLRLLEGAWQDYCQKNAIELSAHQAFCFHTPVYKLVKTGYQHLLRINRVNENRFTTEVLPSLIYNQQIGNCYTASLYLSLISCLSNTPTLKAGDKIGCYSYGSGSTGEFFNVQLVPGYEQQINTLTDWLTHRQMISYDTYCEFEQIQNNLFNGQNFEFQNAWTTGNYYLKAIINNERFYAHKELAN